MAITATFAGQDAGPEIRRGTRVSEYIQITGATGIAGDQALNYKPRFVKGNPKILGGAFAVIAVDPDPDSPLGTPLVDIEARVALANTTVIVELVGEY